MLSDLATAQQRCEPEAETVEQRLQRVIAAHFDPMDGSAFWLDRARQLHVDPLRQVRRVEDLPLLGDVTADDLRRRPLLDYIPRRLHGRLDQFTVAQTGGTTGTGVWTAYSAEEFIEAFVLPFVAAAGLLNFPAQQQWLFVGPSGPHIIGKAVRHLAAALGSPEPYAVDFDPRWAKKLPEGSFAQQRYLAHVIEQAMDVIRTQDVSVLFTTPRVLDALAREMTQLQRSRIRGVHYGGMALEPQQLEKFQQDFFPEAVHLSGYGNTLFGCCLELSIAPGRDLNYYPYGRRLLLEVVDERGVVVADGHLGRVRFTRLDESMLIVRMLERDVAEAIPARGDVPPEFHLAGVRNPCAAPALKTPVAIGLY